MKVVVCGSFKRDRPGLVRDAQILQDAGCQILSPESFTFGVVRDGFVYLHGQSDQHPGAIERAHLERILAADFVWLHCPGGYVGQSAALEIGFCHAMGVPVWAAEQPEDVTLKTFLSVAFGGPLAALRCIANMPRRSRVIARSLQDLQAQVAPWGLKNFGDASRVHNAGCLGLFEEGGELARAIAKMNEGIRGTREEWLAEASKEIGDCLIKLVDIADRLGLSAHDCVWERWADGPKPIRERDWTKDKQGHGLPQEVA